MTGEPTMGTSIRTSPPGARTCDSTSCPVPRVAGLGPRPRLRPCGDGHQAGVIVAVPNNSGFADRWRYVRWDNNLVDSEAKIELLWNRFTDFSIFERCGFDKNGVQAPVVLDQAGNLPKNSPYTGIYGR